jgi:hypothetical protein
VVKAVRITKLSALRRIIKMKRTFKYALSAVAAMVLSLTLAGVAAAQCTLETSDAYTCYVTGQDANYCYYTCYCKTNRSDCIDALINDGFTIM